jgi:hypothetical protein
LLATRYFQDARKIAPNSPEIYYNLGLAESKIPGRELRAICWFGAYLAATTNAPNAAAVKDQIDALDIKSQSNISHLIQSVRDAAGKISDTIPEYCLAQIAGLWAETGDMTSAMQTAGSIQDAYRKNQALADIADGQAEAGDIVGALKTADAIPDALSKSTEFRSIENAQKNAGDMEGARKTLLAAKNAADLISAATKEKSMEIATVAEAQAEIGDIADAQITLADAQTAFTAEQDSSGLFNNKHSIDLALIALGEAQAKAGDISGAQKTLGLIPQSDNASSLLAFIEAKADAGDFTGAQENADRCQDPLTKEMAGKYISDHRKSAASSTTVAQAPVQPTVLVTVQPVIIASDWVKKLDATYSDCALNTDQFLDLSSYLTAQHSDYPQNLFSMLHDTAEKIIKAQIVIDQMLKQQAKQQAQP